ncbi:SIS domain-containing protein [Rathayibacter sp. VKM Ac-2927]|uniref:SIS domain-containing protein n=1 Tax=Rathayibacter sp. VKM Ac-2927 TaxID=2929478 RepID=UPI001FB50C2E|nr:SIS domain-containing protein [Rathayibacter sp. VKM Ac-2927]MCJ1686993.1 SIS domain-containing protein [Rathayibacter sp. VKM Ac-2927]
MTDGTYLGSGPVAPVPDDIAPSIEHALSLWPAIDRFVSTLPAVDRVLLVGAGGSLMGVQAAQYLLDSAAITPAASYNSDEFFHRAPASVGPGALVIVLSGTGETPETVRAGEWAQQRGAAVAGVTLKAEGPLAVALDTAFVARTGQGTQVVLQLLALAVLRRDGVDVEERLAALRALPAAMVAAVEAFEPRARTMAEALKDVQVTYLITSGSLMGPGQTFTTCYLQEMQWMHAATINADEFFQGPFEVFDAATQSILFLAEDATRPMGERAQTFLDQYSGTTHTVDSRSIELPGVAADQRAFVAPLVFSTLVSRLAAHWAAARGYALEGRRYMWQFAY